MSTSARSILVTVAATLAVALLPAAAAHSKTGKPVERWKCYSPMDFFGGKEKVIVKALRYEMSKEIAAPFTRGEIHVAGQVYKASFTVEGFDRTWYFGPLEDLDADKPTVFMFSIRPDGIGFYYDFSDVAKGEKTTSSQVFRCVEK